MHAPNASQRGRRRVRVRVQGGDLHLGITVHMHIITCTRARMYTCMRALVECISARACAGLGAGVGARAAGAGVHLLCVTSYILYRCIPTYECRHVWLYNCMLAYICVCVLIIYILIYIYIYLQRNKHIYIYMI